jgi:hypothetical protein
MNRSHANQVKPITPNIESNEMRPSCAIVLLTLLTVGCASGIAASATQPALTDLFVTAAALPTVELAATPTFAPGWEIINKTMPDPRGEMPAVVLGDKFYVPGGMTKLSQIGGTWSMQGTGSLAVFDPVTATWSQGAAAESLRRVEPCRGYHL